MIMIEKKEGENKAMKKTLTVLLALLLLLSLLASCTTPDAPPQGDGTGEGDTTEQSTEAQTDPFFTPAEWWPKVKEFWDALLAGEATMPEKVTATDYWSLSSQFPKSEDVTDTEQIAAILDAIKACDAYLTKPVSNPDYLFTNVRGVSWDTENGSFLFFVAYTPYAEDGVKIKDVYCLGLSLQAPAGGMQAFTTSFELTSEQYSTIRQALNTALGKS